MKITDLFAKDINRNIETVIKADDQEHILDEVFEYVITNEVSKKISSFFSAYNDYKGANGVWISGFFGSGKSHLLKILSYVLENKEYDGYKLGEVFAEKIEDDAMLKADILSSTKYPSESILFNIDQQAQITSKQEEDALLNVFYKVFYDHLGYFGSQKHVAEFERWLDSEGVYKKFQEDFEKIFGEFWTNARRKYFAPKVKETIGKVLSNLLGDTPEKYTNIIDTLRTDSTISVDDFSNKIVDYLNTKQKGFRLNFFVDEVGQYISDNSKLMLNLQTIAETLATRTKGNSWVFVTSQEDMESIVGDMNKSQQNDFSKIQARFYFKIPLTSANVDEVIEKRLLSKTESGSTLLKQTYTREAANMETLLSFSDSGVQFKKYKDSWDFINKYPFVIYQFDLFQQCIRALSNHNAFQGKHASVGERSMIGVFQHVVKKLNDKDETTLVSFDLLFEGIRSSIKGELQNSITLAEKNLDNDFAIQVLKALFMVKYYSNFRTTFRNISTLMVDKIQIDLKEHEREVQLALNVLENQTYIQRNGDLYEFLTDDEKDIEREIKETDIDDPKVTELFKEILFDEIIHETRIRFVENKQDYEYTSKIDGVILGREKELQVEIITQNFVDYNRESFYKSQTMGFTTLMMMVLPNDEHVLTDIRMYLKTDKYIRQSQSTTNKDNVKRILFEKAQQNSLRRTALVAVLRQMLGESDVYMNGMKVQISSSSDGKNKLVNAFQMLVKQAYPNLKMLGNSIFSEEAIKGIIKNHQDDLFGTDDTTISQSESEVLNIIQRRKKQSDRTSLTDLKEHFAKRPYGWYQNAIWCVTAQLYKRGKIELRQDSNLLDDDGALNAFLNNRYYGSTILEPQIDFDPRQVKELAQIYSEFSDEACPVKEAKDVALAFKNKIAESNIWVNQLLTHNRDYPFLSALLPVSEYLDKLNKKEYSYYLTSIKDYEHELLDHKEHTIDPIKRFWNGEQKKIFDSVKAFLSGDQSNLQYVDGDELDILNDLMNNPEPYRGDPIKDAKSAKDGLTQKVLKRIEEERQITIQAINDTIVKIKNHDDFKSLYEASQKDLLKPFQDELNKLKDQRYIANLRDIRSNKIKHLLELQLNEMVKLAHPPVKDSVANEPVIHYQRISSVKLNYSKAELQSKEDVARYIDELKRALNELIDNNKRISL
jgi:hypothetical protein